MVQKSGERASRKESGEETAIEARGSAKTKNNAIPLFPRDMLLAPLGDVLVSFGVFVFYSLLCCVLGMGQQQGLSPA